MTEQTTAPGTRVLRALAGSAAPGAVAAGAASLGAYHALRGQPPGIRVTIALALAGLTAVAADRHARRPGRPGPETGTAPGTTPSLPGPASAQLAADALAHAAVQAAAGAQALDRSGGALTRPGNWRGSEDGSATFALTPTARLLHRPAGPHGRYPGDCDRPRRYELLVDGELPVVITTITQLTGLLRRHAAGRPPAADEPAALPRPRHRRSPRLGQGRPLRPLPRPERRSRAEGPC
ncbi:hypothetical protein [Kitasatospora sp. NPDC091207]|uniref:hypothetical protein n=1 Tax=Kitasatospora sp. NPDC091207 TaxID=3364083 RepID=UPI00382BD74E